MEIFLLPFQLLFRGEVFRHTEQHIAKVEMVRSLTKRQRELLQEYADDVEGRSHTPQHKAHNPRNPKEEVVTDKDNGTDYFIRYSAPSGGWISRAWQNMRRFIGL